MIIDLTRKTTQEKTKPFREFVIRSGQHVKIVKVGKENLNTLWGKHESRTIQ